MDAKMIRVVEVNGRSFHVDTSDEACNEFGFSHEETVYCKMSKEKGAVVGVETCGNRKYLWVAFDHKDGKVSRCSLHPRHSNCPYLL